MAETYGMTLLLRDDPAAVERYKAEHAAAWPPVIDGLRRIGVLEMEIYLRGRRLFLWMKAVDGFDPETGFSALPDDPAYQEWDELMTSLQERAPEAGENEWWADMEKVFDLNWPQYTEGR